MVVVGCEKKEAAQEHLSADVSGEAAPGIAGQLPPSDVTAKPGEAMIDEPGQEFPVEGLYLNPYFDDAGTQTELAVAPDVPFSVNVFGETAEPYSTNAIQYRIVFPDGIEVMGVKEFEHKSVSTGDPKVNYMLAYDCQPPGRYRLVTYVCRATKEFKGGEVELLDGLAANGINFIGFVSCDFTEMRATGGTATLTRR